MGDGEDIGSDLDGDDEEEEEDEDGGFVVPDGYGSDDCEGEDAAKSKKRKLEQVLTLPPVIFALFRHFGLSARTCARALLLFACMDKACIRLCHILGVFGSSFVHLHWDRLSTTVRCPRTWRRC
jgi:hypothetical protein